MSSPYPQYYPSDPAAPQQAGATMPSQAQYSYPPMAYPEANYPSAYPVMTEPPQATTTLVLGIVGLVCCGICAPFAWYFGNKGIRQIESGQYTDSSQLRTGRVLGIVGTVMLIVSAIIVIVFVGFALWAAAEYGGLG